MPKNLGSISSDLKVAGPKFIVGFVSSELSSTHHFVINQLFFRLATISLLSVFRF